MFSTPFVPSIPMRPSSYLEATLTFATTTSVFSKHDAILVNHILSST